MLGKNNCWGSDMGYIPRHGSLEYLRFKHAGETQTTVHDIPTIDVEKAFKDYSIDLKRGE